MPAPVGQPAPPEQPAPPPPKVEAPPLPAVEEPPPPLLYSKGDMEGILGFSLGGDGDVNYLGFSGKFAYFVIDRLAPGIELRYTNIVGEGSEPYGYADSITLLPLLKFVLTRKQVAPYIFVNGGYEWQWGARSAANAWILGFGGGVNVSVTKHVMINVELAAEHYWYTKKKIYWYKDSDLAHRQDDSSAKIYKDDCSSSAADVAAAMAMPGDPAAPKVCGPADIPDNFQPAEGGGEYALTDSEGNEYYCNDDGVCTGDATFKDKKDVDREWFFPLISVGVTIAF
jgi:hypothetical protein